MGWCGHSSKENIPSDRCTSEAPAFCLYIGSSSSLHLRSRHHAFHLVSRSFLISRLLVPFSAAATLKLELVSFAGDPDALNTSDSSAFAEESREGDVDRAKGTVLALPWPKLVSQCCSPFFAAAVRTRLDLRAGDRRTAPGSSSLTLERAARGVRAPRVRIEERGRDSIGDSSLGGMWGSRLCRDRRVTDKFGLG